MGGIRLTRRGRAIALVCAGALALAAGVWVLRGPGQSCTARVDGHTVRLDPAEADGAARIVAVAVRRGLPARAATVALLAAYEDGGLGKADPEARAGRVYDALGGVSGYRSMSAPRAAAKVGRSSDADDYAEHEADARVLASALSGNSPATLSCRLDDDADGSSRRLDGSGLVPRAEAVRTSVRDDFGRLPMGGFAPGGVRTGHMAGSAHYEGRAVDVFFRPVNARNRVRGWALAQFLVARADALDIATVILDDRIWTAARSDEGWRDYHPPERSGDRAILEHRDHVHVDVFR